MALCSFRQQLFQSSGSGKRRLIMCLIIIWTRPYADAYPSCFVIIQFNLAFIVSRGHSSLFSLRFPSPHYTSPNLSFPRRKVVGLRLLHLLVLGIRWLNVSVPPVSFVLCCRTHWLYLCIILVTLVDISIIITHVRVYVNSKSTYSHVPEDRQSGQGGKQK